jgi:chromosome segregation ATPase
MGAYLFVKGLQADNKALTAQVIQLKSNIEQLQAAIDSKEKELERARQDREDVRVELASIRSADTSLRQEVAELRSQITSQEKQEQLDRVSRSKKASLHLRLVNKGAKCQWEHFDDFSGTCKGGRWVSEPENRAEASDE